MRYLHSLDDPDDAQVTAIGTSSNADVWERKRVQMSLRIECAGLALLSERLLGMPREPATDRDVPFSEVVRRRDDRS